MRFSYNVLCIYHSMLCCELTNQGLPFAIGLCDLIDAAHLAVGHASDDEDDDARACFHLRRALVLVPVTVAGTATGSKDHTVTLCVCLRERL